MGVTIIWDVSFSVAGFLQLELFLLLLFHLPVDFACVPNEVAVR